MIEWLLPMGRLVFALMGAAGGLEKGFTQYAFPPT